MAKHATASQTDSFFSATPAPAPAATADWSGPAAPSSSGLSGAEAVASATGLGDFARTASRPVEDMRMAQAMGQIGGLPVSAMSWGDVGFRAPQGVMGWASTATSALSVAGDVMDIADNGLDLQNGADLLFDGAGLAGSLMTGPAGWVLEAGALGYKLGTALDDTFHISDNVVDAILPSEGIEGMPDEVAARRLTDPELDAQVRAAETREARRGDTRTGLRRHLAETMFDGDQMAANRHLQQFETDEIIDDWSFIGLMYGYVPGAD